MFSTLNRVLVTAAIAVSTLSAHADERGTKAEAMAMVDAAHAHIQKVGSAKAFADFNEKSNADWHKKDLYVFVAKADGVVVSHGVNEKLIGKSLWELKDQEGKLFMQEIVATAKKGKGWVDYEWSHPQTKKVESKTTYVRWSQAADGAVAVGAYR